ncbi:baculoviral IAP repeat-containing protein 2-like [Ornithodoros turicata]|uniref:baculoviral IAP repeat-containing protein 2-like n=1 Tax=Ornithodoros turicata TaxID=34597 RepID=UPI00313956BC
MARCTEILRESVPAMTSVDDPEKDLDQSFQWRAVFMFYKESVPAMPLEDDKDLDQSFQLVIFFVYCKESVPAMPLEDDKDLDQSFQLVIFFVYCKDAATDDVWLKGGRNHATYKDVTMDFWNWIHHAMLDKAGLALSHETGSTQLHRDHVTKDYSNRDSPKLHISTPNRDQITCARPRKVDSNTTIDAIDNHTLLENELNSFLERCPAKWMEWSDLNKRLKSYETAPDMLKRKRDVFAGIGLYFAENVTTCFHCGGCHGDWTDAEEPFVEHCRWYPQCRLIRILAGDDIVNYITGQHEDHMNMLVRRGRQEAEERHKALVEDLFTGEDLRFYEQNGIMEEVLHLAAASLDHHGHVTMDDVIHEMSKLCQLNLDRDWRTIPRNKEELSLQQYVPDGNPPGDQHGAGPSNASSHRPGTYGALSTPKHPRFERFDVRYATFDGFPGPRTELLSRERLADAGLFYTNKNDETVCFYCGGTLSHWESFDDPYKEHARWHPSCDYIHTVMQRRDSDSGFFSMTGGSQPETDSGIVHESAVATNVHGTVSETSGRSIAVADDASQVTRLADVWGSNRSYQEEGLTMRNNAYTVLPSKPTHPQFAKLDRRVMSFESYPRHAKGNKEKMAKAGLFYTGAEDRTACFQCGNTLCSWGEEDDPLLEHARWYPNCPYVILMLGTATINDIRKAHKNTLAERRTAEISQSDELTNYLLRQLMSAPIVYRLTAQGIDHLIVELAILKRLNGNGLIDVLDEEDLRRALTEVVSLPENVRTKEISKADTGDLSKCIVCKTGDRHTIFLPCNHLIACSRCAESRSVCPSCNRSIATRRQAFLA